MTGRLTASSLGPEHWGFLARSSPLSEQFGIDRGVPIDRIFIDTFLTQHSDLIRGRILEVGDDRYARRYGRARLTEVDIVDIDRDNGSATIFADLAQPGSIPQTRYDCAIVTQALQYVADVDAAVRNLHGCLVRGGALLATVPGITRIDAGDSRDADRWRFTPNGLCKLLSRAFAAGDVACAGYGDLQTATAFLYGLAAEDIALCRGDARTSDFPVVVCAVARRR